MHWIYDTKEYKEYEKALLEFFTALSKEMRKKFSALASEVTERKEKNYE